MVHGGGAIRKKRRKTAVRIFVAQVLSGPGSKKKVNKRNAANNASAESNSLKRKPCKGKRGR